MSVENEGSTAVETPVSDQAPADPIYEMQVEGGQYDPPADTSVADNADADNTPAAEVVPAVEIPATDADQASSQSQATPDAETMRRAEIYGIDPAEFAGDVTGLKRTIGVLDRRAADEAREFQRQRQEANKVVEPPQPTMVDRLKEAGVAEDDPMMIVAAENDALRKRVSDNEQRSVAYEREVQQRREADTFIRLEGSLVEIDDALYGKGELDRVSPEARQARLQNVVEAKRLLDAYAVIGEQITEREAAEIVYSRRHSDRTKTKLQEQVRTAINDRRGTPTNRSSQPAATRAEPAKFGKQAAIDEARKLIAENPELEQAGWRA